MSFDRHYERFLQRHLHSRSGERLRRLTEGHGHAERTFLERVWWPAVGSFDYLHPEYEVADFKDGTRYLDFAYIRPPLRVCMEIDGYGPHLRDVSRTQFADQLWRQNDLEIDGWRIIRFAYDDVEQKPRRCQQTIHQWMGLWCGADTTANDALSRTERRLAEIALRKLAPVTPKEAGERLGISTRHARTLLQRLVSASVLLPASGERRIRAYVINPNGRQLFL
ncbi:DNA-binding response regulator [Paenibacillus ginsengarvi]|uniref:DNA-binding response regulator n=1 Tax=Paenibacillus ginsengarvi TaxID=400777 RepID=A0A3B0CL09_9BACL|nr:DNA-binding response regulator [Paenibacillus ginsengarvi]RKN85541.1 DNA-binding response regulator [Paenibacillus ginsengarvi]